MPSGVSLDAEFIQKKVEWDRTSLFLIDSIAEVLL
jgi:hypothetical protein